LVGQSHLTKPLAAALLQITGDGKPQPKQHDDDPAISALRRLYPQPSLGQRYIHLSQTLETVVDVRMDHIVFVGPHQEATKEPAGVDYTHLQHRLSRVVVLLEDSTYVPKPPKRRIMTTFYVRANDHYFTGSLAHMILQRARVGARYKAGVSPMIFGAFG